MRRFLFAILFVFLATGSLARCQTTTSLVLWLSAEQARPGEEIMAALHLKMAPKWHTYWKFPGDAGEPTKIQWQLPPGWEAADMLWPVPEKHVLSDITTYVYYGEAVLLAPIRIPATANPGEVTLKAKVTWQECEELCVRGKKDVEVRLRIGETSKPSAESARISEARRKIPSQEPKLALRAILSPGATPDEPSLAIEWPLNAPAEGFDFFPNPEVGVEVSGTTEIVKAGVSGGGGMIRKKLTLIEGKLPAKIAGLLVWGKGEGREVSLDLEKAGVATGVSPGSNGATLKSGEGVDGTADSPRKSLPWMLLFAFLGGLILNFMPCVLPVIALKVLSFVNQSKEAPRRVRTLGLVYGLGVLASFLVLSLLAIGAQRAGGLASWGMALQNQVFRSVLVIVVTLVALNLFGVFEVTLHGGVMGAASQLTAQEGLGGAFFNGVLATILATPCTAPFLGAALAFAFTQPPGITVLMFLVSGAGLASPFVLLCWNPAWIRWLPKPGVWMLRFKVAMGFPMLATAVWLFWFTAPRYGKSGVLWFGLFLVALSMAAWIFGELVQKSGKGRGLAGACAVLVVLASYFGLLEAQLHWRTPPEKQAANALKEGPDGIDWRVWNPAAVLAAREKGVPILVDFTADNCLNCQVNKKTSLEIAQTRSKLKEIGAISFLGDFSDEDPQIAMELRRHQRAGVPLVLVYPRNKTKPPVVLPVLLTPSIVLEALTQAAAQ